MKTEVYMHYTIKERKGLFYTREAKIANAICVHTQSYPDNFESGGYDIIDEQIFPNSSKGMRKAERYAENLCEKYKTGYEFY